MPVELPLHKLSVAVLLALVPTLGCTGRLEGPSSSSTGDGTPTTQGPDGGPGPVAAQGVDPGRVDIHRLNNTEYDNTVRDLLGTALKPAAGFLAEEGNHFDNTASALGMNASQYEKYLAAATDLMTESLGNAASKAR
jgi:hypothetical protein